MGGCCAYNISQEIMTLICSTTTCVTYAQQLLCVRTHHVQVVFVEVAGCMAAEHSGIRSEYRHSLYVSPVSLGLTRPSQASPPQRVGRCSQSSENAPGPDPDTAT